MPHSAHRFRWAELSFLRYSSRNVRTLENKEEPTSDRLLATKGSLDTVVGSSTDSILTDSQNVNEQYDEVNMQEANFTLEKSGILNHRYYE